MTSEHVLPVADAVSLLAAHRSKPTPDPWSIGYCIPCRRYIGEGDWLCVHLRDALDAGPSHTVARMEDRAVLEQAA